MFFIGFESVLVVLKVILVVLKVFPEKFAKFYQPNAHRCSINAGSVCLSFLEVAPVVGFAPSFWCSDTIVGLISTFLQCVMLGSQDCTKLVDMKVVDTIVGLTT